MYTKSKIFKKLDLLKSGNNYLRNTKKSKLLSLSNPLLGKSEVG